ncbi:unnamed protein product [Cylindrotheca closterium]|uniref:Uncharacterized protein n=1 Tax=Cylindrotheca closterium TaxID=2856 RepID=A0AAD2G5D7_9STRA|nr:unnamed protein product [Cylindrotheca closterium]
MDEETLGPSPDEIMALGAMVERTLTCKCRGGHHDDDEGIDIGKSLEGYARGMLWHKTNISWDDATLETTCLTDEPGLVELDITARSMSILSSGDEADDADDNLSEILDTFVPNKESKKKKSFKFLPVKTKKRIPTQEASSICATIKSVEGDEKEFGFEVEYHPNMRQ